MRAHGSIPTRARAPLASRASLSLISPDGGLSRAATTFFYLILLLIIAHIYFAIWLSFAEKKTKFSDKPACKMINFSFSLAESVAGL